MAEPCSWIEASQGVQLVEAPELIRKAMHKTDYKDLPSDSDKTDQATRNAAANTARLARLLANAPYPA
jgi:hypothetical protein